MSIDRLRLRRPRADVLGWLAIAAAVAVAYGSSARWPLAFDDAWSVRLVEGYTFLDAFTRTANFGYYRPLYLLAYMLAHSAGANGPVLLHALCLAAHTINAILLTRLVRALNGRPEPWVELGTGLLYALNPFVFQAVALPAGLNHLLALMFILAASLAYARVRAGQPHGWPLVLSATALAVLSNEIGVVAAGFCLVYEIARAWRERRWQRSAWSFLPVAALCAGYLVIYPLIPKGQAPESALTLADLAQRALYAAQLWCYPLAALLKPLIPGNELAVAAAAALTAATCLLAMKSRWRILVAAGTLIFWGAATPPLARLSAGYLLNAPRALYVPLAGSALVWTALLLALADGITSRRPQVVAVARSVALSLVALLGLGYAASQSAIHASALAPVAAVARNGAQIGPGEMLTVLNLPEWVAPIQRFFPIGSEGVIVMAPYVGGDDLVLANTGLHRQVDVRRYPLPYDAALNYVYQLWGEPADRAGLPQALPSAARVVATAYQADTLRGDWIGGFEPAAGPATSPAARFGGRWVLAAYHAQPCREGWMLATRWHMTDGPALPVTLTLSLFAQVFDGAGARVAQGDGALLGGLIGFGEVPGTGGREVVDRRRLTGASQSAVTLAVGVYDYQTGQRLEARDGAGARLGGDALVITAPPPDATAPCD